MRLNQPINQLINQSNKQSTNQLNNILIDTYGSELVDNLNKTISLFRVEYCTEM